MTGSAKREKRPPQPTAKSKTAQQGPALDRGIQAQIGDRLRSLYGELLDQPIPDRLTAIMEKLGETRGKSGS